MPKTTSAERMRKMRELARSEYAESTDPATVAGLSLSALLELYAAEVRRCHRDGSRSRSLYRELAREVERRVTVTDCQPEN